MWEYFGGVLSVTTLTPLFVIASWMPHFHALVVSPFTRNSTLSYTILGKKVMMMIHEKKKLLFGTSQISSYPKSDRGLM